MLGGCVKKRWIVGAALTLLMVGLLMACSKSVTTLETDATPTPDFAAVINTDMTSTPRPSITLTPPVCVGLFVHMLDRYSLSSALPVKSLERGGLWFNQRVYMFELGEPITVTTAVLVFGSGQMGVVETFPPGDFDIEIIDQYSCNVPLTSEGERLFARGVFSSRGYVIDQNVPFLATFRIDEWFDLSKPGTYTMTLTRRRQGPPSEIRGNPVTFVIQTPRP